ncbi:type VI immunity family protein [Paraburkholderia sp. DD10]|uniref:type VI immunity family protein n=1 Tax=Paraburkholderia sp. DD10 TaxID=3409691 RepID=UPI003A06FC29
MNLSLTEAEANTPTEYWLARRYLALDVGNPLLNATHLRSKLTTVSWLTCLDKTLLEQVGGISALRSELPRGQTYGKTGCVPVLLWRSIVPVVARSALSCGPMPRPYTARSRWPSRIRSGSTRSGRC